MEREERVYLIAAIDITDTVSLEIGNLGGGSLVLFGRGCIYIVMMH
jgi:hypothetical protein